MARRKRSAKFSGQNVQARKRLYRMSAKSKGISRSLKTAWNMLGRRPGTAMGLMFIAGKKAGWISAKKGRGRR